MPEITYELEDTLHEPEDIPLLGLSPKVIKQAAVTHFPTPISKKAFSLTDEEKIAKIDSHFRQILITLGLDLENDSIAHTSYRLAKMYVKEIFSGLNPSNFPSMSFLEDSSLRDNEQLISVKEIEIVTFSEHDFTPITGMCHISYLPQKKVIGLSKINRIVQFHCKKPQLQERLTAQIADSLKIILGTEDIAVYTRLKHFSVTMRGAQDKNSETETSLLKGKFKTDSYYRQEFSCNTRS